MKILLIICLFISSTSVFGQECDKIFAEDRFTKTKNTNFYLTGIEGYQPYSQLSIEISGDKKFSENGFSISCSIGTGKKDSYGLIDYSSLTSKFILNEHNSITLYFLFEDDKSFSLNSSPQIIYGTSVYFDKKDNLELFAHLKTKKITDIRLIFNLLTVSYAVPLSNNENLRSDQAFFMNIIKCLNW